MKRRTYGFKAVAILLSTAMALSNPMTSVIAMGNPSAQSVLLENTTVTENNVAVTNGNESESTNSSIIIAGEEENTGEEKITGEEEVLDVFELTNAVEKGTEIYEKGQGSYSDGTWTEFIRVLSEGKNVLVDNSAYNQSQVDEITQDILSAIANMDRTSIDFATKATSNREGLNSLESLMDGDAATFTGDLKWDKGFTLDFGEAGRVKLNQVDMQARLGFGNRMLDGKVKGSNDGSAFVELSANTAINSTEMQSLAIKEEYQNTAWRYIRIEGVGASNIFSVGELRLYGEYIELQDCIDSISIISSNTDSTTAEVGDIITVEVKGNKDLQNVGIILKNIGRLNKEKLNFDAAMSMSGKGDSWKGTYTVGEYDFTGKVDFEVSYEVAETGEEGITETVTSDTSSVIIKKDKFIDITDPALGVKFGVATVASEEANRGANYDNGVGDTQIGYITDKTYLTNSEQNLGNGWWGTIFLDFGEENSVYLQSAQIIARQGFPDRVAGIGISGSNDGKTWTELTSKAVNTVEWQTLDSLDKGTNFRYFMIWGGRYLNISEIKLFGRVRAEGELYLWGLKDTVDEGEVINKKGQNHYSDETWKAFKTALDTGKTTLENSSSYSQSQIDEVVTNLLTAIEELAEPLPWFVDTEGTALKHPAIGISGERLEEVREHILKKEQPWYDYYLAFRQTTFASKAYVSRNDTYPNTDQVVAVYGFKSYNTNLFNNQMTQDGKAVFYQALMYYFTGEKEYRANAIRILRLWSQVNPEECTYTSDAHIHMGVPLTLFNSGAELIRYTSTFENDSKYVWTQNDSRLYYTNFLEQPLKQWLDKNRYWMNQQQFSNMAAMSAYIFNDDKEGYEKLVERTMVNSGLETEDDIYQNGAFANAFFAYDVDYMGNQLDKTYYAVKEMARDQSHAYDNVENAGILAQLMMAQGTKVDPVSGTISTKADAVDAYEFMNRCILKGTNTFCGFALGYPVPFSDGREGNGPSDGYRGRLNNVSQVYYYYKYALGYKNTDEDFKYLDQYFNSYEATIGVPIDESWIYIPEEAAGSDMPNTTSNHVDGTHQIEFEYTDLSENMITEKTENGQKYLNVQATEEGTSFVLYGNGIWSGISFYISTTESSRLARYDERTGEILESYYVPDTDGEWRYCTYSFSPGMEMIFLKVIGEGEVKLDHYKVNNSNITPPVFDEGVEKIGYAYQDQAYSVLITAKDSNANHTISYSVVGAPEGVTINESGLLSWKIPENQQTGEVTFYVYATDGESVSSLTLRIMVERSFREVIESVISLYDENEIYETASLKKYREALEIAEALVAAGTDEARATAIANLQVVVTGLRLLNPRLSDGGFDLSKIVMSVDNLPISNMAILTDMNGSGTANLWGNQKKSFTMDFGVDFQVSLSSVIMSVVEGWSARGDGMQIFGSNDMINWNPLLKEVSKAVEGYQTLTVLEEQKGVKYRFLKVIDMNGGVLNRDQTTEDQPFALGELHLIGERTETVNEVVSASLTSNQLYGYVDGEEVHQSYYAGVGDTLTVRFETKEEIAQAEVTIVGRSAEVIKEAGKNVYTASLTLDSSVTDYVHPFTIDYTCMDGRQGSTVYFATDHSKVLINGQTDNISDIMKTATVTSSAGPYTTENVGVLFDGNIETSTEFRNNGLGWGSWMMFDLGENNKVKLSRVDILARTFWESRVAGTYIQGSDDGENWNDITTLASGVVEWQQLYVNEIEKDQAYRYIRVINGGNWFGNMSEIRFYGEYGNLTSGEKPIYSYSVTTQSSIPEGGATIAFVNNTESNDPPEPGEDYIDTKLEDLEKGTSVTVIAKPAKGYRFVKWVSEEEIMGMKTYDYIWSTYPKFTIINYGGGYLGAPLSYGVNKEWKLTAVFEKTGTDYTVRFEKNNETEAEVLTVWEGELITKPEDPVRKGYTFIGWYLDEKLHKEWDFAKDKVTKDLVLYAGWEKDDNPVGPTNPDDSGNNTDTEDTSGEENSSKEGVIELTADSDIMEIKLSDLQEILGEEKLTEITIIVHETKENDKIVLTKEVLELLVVEDKNVTIQVNSIDGKNVTWRFIAKEVATVKKYTDIILNVQTKTVENAKKVDAVVKKIFGKKVVNGGYISIAGEESFGISAKLTVSIGKILDIVKGSRVYIYHVNEKTGKLETIVEGYSQYVDSNSKVTLPVLESGEYVVLAKKADSKKVVSLKNQISVKAKSSTIAKGKSTAVIVELPTCLRVTPDLSEKTVATGIGAVSISYKTSDKTIATVNKTGKITAKKKSGKVIITATIKLYNGTTKTVKLKINIK